MLLLKLAAVAAGGAMGAMLRFSSNAVLIHWLGRDFPYHTIFVNVCGSLLVGYALVWLPQNQPDSEFIRLALVTGLLGGFTTFSAFSMETLLLFQNGEPVKAGLNVLLTLLLCLSAVWLGWSLGRWLHPAV